MASIRRFRNANDLTQLTAVLVSLDELQDLLHRYVIHSFPNFNVLIILGLVYFSDPHCLPKEYGTLFAFIIHSFVKDFVSNV